MSRYIYFLISSVIALTSLSVIFDKTKAEFHLFALMMFIVGAYGAIYNTWKMSKEDDNENN